MRKSLEYINIIEEKNLVRFKVSTSYREFLNYPERFVYKQKPKKGQVKEAFKVYTCVEEKYGKVIFPKRQASGIYTLSIQEQGKMVYNKLLEYFGTKRITYITDSNQMDDEWFQVAEGSHYKGIFALYDSFRSKNNTSIQSTTGGAKLSKKKKQITTMGEFQEYELTKENGELMFLDDLYVKSDLNTGSFSVMYSIKKTTPRKILIGNETQSNSKDPRGLSLFLMLFNEINKKTLGFKQLSSIRKDKAEEILTKIHSVGLTSLATTYKITLKLKESSNVGKDNKSDTGIIPLAPEDFIMALFDFKRAMDYLYVKACHQANTAGNTEFVRDEEGNLVPRTKIETEKDHRYVFVSADRSAVLYSILLGNPTILTPPVIQSENSKEHKCERGNHYIKLFDPMRAQEQNNANTQAKNVQVQSQAHKENSVQDLSRKLANVTLQNSNAQAQVQDEDYEEEETATKNFEAAATTFQQMIRPTRTSRLNNVAGPSTSKSVQQNAGPFPSPQAQKTDLQIRCEEYIATITANPKAKHLVNPFKTDKKVSNKQHIKKMCEAELLKIEIAKGKQRVKARRPQLPHMQGGANSNDNEIYARSRLRSLLNEEIPIETMDDLDAFGEEGSPFRGFMTYYAKLTPTVTFFWYLTFKSLMFFVFGDEMNRAKSEILQNNNSKVNIPTTPYKPSRTLSLNINTAPMRTSVHLRTLSTNNTPFNATNNKRAQTTYRIKHDAA